MANILSVAISGKTKTCIMHKCNLSYKQLKAYLDLLQEKRLLQIGSQEGNNPEKVYITTERGRAFLKAYNRLKATIERDRKFGFRA
jgi:predicted transcriptional regulator